MPTAAVPVAEIQRRDRDLYAMAYVDALTGLSNRAHFIRELDSLARDGALPCGTGLFIFEINKFTLISNALGQTLGDLLLQAIAARL